MAARELVGSSPVIRQLRELLPVLAGSVGSVLILGEPGSGREHVAHLLHEAGDRRGKPFRTVHCGSPDVGPEGRASVLRSAAEAAGGTLFLREISELPLDLQAELVASLRPGRALDRSGPTRIDVRLVSCAAEDPDDAARAGRLRRDLLGLISVHRIAVPPLREHLDDLLELTLALSRRFVSRVAPKPFSPDTETLSEMARYTWPGNVQELANVIEHAVIVGAGDRLRLPDLPEYFRQRLDERRPKPAPPRASASNAKTAMQIHEFSLPDIPSNAFPTLSDAMKAFEKGIIAAGLARTGGNKSRLAKDLGISRSNLIAKVHEYGLDDEW